jgi:hypothetical protein
VQALTRSRQTRHHPEARVDVAAANILLPWIAGKLLDYSARRFGTGTLP